MVVFDSINNESKELLHKDIELYEIDAHPTPATLIPQCDKYIHLFRKRRDNYIELYEIDPHPTPVTLIPQCDKYIHLEKDNFKFPLGCDNLN
jgi:hypothetical protein